MADEGEQNNSSVVRFPQSRVSKNAAPFREPGQSLLARSGVAAADGILVVADAWNHRVLLGHNYPQASNRAADVVIGQQDFTTRFSNRGESSACANTLNWCDGVTIASGRLFVADTGNRRVLVWNEIPAVNGTPADLVLGQSDFSTRDECAGQGAGALGMRWPHAVAVAGDAILVADAGDNRWRPAARDSLCWPHCVSCCNETLVIADSGNNRVLLWEKAP